MFMLSEKYVQRKGCKLRIQPDSPSCLQLQLHLQKFLKRLERIQKNNKKKQISKLINFHLNCVIYR